MAGTTELLRFDVIEPSDIGLLSNEVIAVQLTRELEPELLALMEDFGNAELQQLGVTGAFNVVDARVIGFLTEFSAMRVQGINAVTRSEIARALAEGVLAGEGEVQLGARVRAVFDRASITRAKLIARTEVNAAANFSRTLAMEESGVVQARRWFATRDTRTRRNHMRLHGQVQPLSRAFRIPGTSSFAMYPGGFSSVAENANCRCTVLAVIEPVRDAATIPIESDRMTVAFFDARVLHWEARFERALRRAFRAQEQLVLQMLAARDRSAAA